MKWIKNKLGFFLNRYIELIEWIDNHSRIQCRVQSNNDLRLENELHQQLLIHFGRGVRITQSIVQSCAEKLKKDFPTSSNLGRRWVETFITKKGYTYKRIRGSKELIPNADIELCRNEIRQKTKNTVQEIVSTSMKRDITHIVVKIILIKLMKAGFQIKRGELYHDSWAMTHGPWLMGHDFFSIPPRAWNWSKSMD